MLNKNQRHFKSEMEKLHKEMESRDIYICPSCKAHNVEHQKYCINCGTWLLSTTFPAQRVSKSIKQGTAHRAAKVFSYIILGLITTFGLLSFIASSENVAVNILSTLFALSSTLLILGLISPLIIPGKLRSRGRVIAIYLTGSIIFFFVLGMVSNAPSKVKAINTIVQNQSRTADPNQPTINKEEFAKIETGMTYEQVQEIIGGDGDVMSEMGISGEKHHTIVYMWKGVGIVGANATMTFQNNILLAKAQVGLK